MGLAHLACFTGAFQKQQGSQMKVMDQKTESKEIYKIMEEERVASLVVMKSCNAWKLPHDDFIQKCQTYVNINRFDRVSTSQRVNINKSCSLVKFYAVPVSGITFKIMKVLLQILTQSVTSFGQILKQLELYLGIKAK